MNYNLRLIIYTIILLHTPLAWLNRTFLQVADGLVVILHLQVTLAHEEVSFDRLAVQLQSVFAVCQSFIMLLQPHVAQRSVGVVRWDRRIVDLTE